jgi:hypothetical protein
MNRNPGLAHRFIAQNRGPLPGRWGWRTGSRDQSCVAREVGKGRLENSCTISEEVDGMGCSVMRFWQRAAFLSIFRREGRTPNPAPNMHVSLGERSNPVWHTEKKPPVKWPRNGQDDNLQFLSASVKP